MGRIKDYIITQEENCIIIEKDSDIDYEEYDMFFIPDEAALLEGDYYDKFTK